MASRLSFSMLKSFKTCPKQYYHLREKKDYPWPAQGAEAKEGEAKHTLMEMRLLYSQYTGDHTLEQACQEVIERQGFIVCEHKMCVNSDHVPVPYNDWRNGYLGGLADLVSFGIDGDFRKCLCLDWKFGKFYPDQFQLLVMAVLIFEHYPWIETVEASLEFITAGKRERHFFRMHELPVYWLEIERRHEGVKQAKKSGVWAENKSGLCKAHCNITECQFNGV